MGLVSKKRKIKSTDPFSKKFRTLDDDLVADDVHELAPPEREAPKKSINSMIIKEVFNKKKVIAAERKKNDEKMKGKAPVNKLSGRFPGESIRAYKKRLRAETHAIIMEQSKALSKTNKKRKEFLSDKKKGHKKVKLNDGTSFEEADEDDVDDEENFDEEGDGKAVRDYEKKLLDTKYTETDIKPIYEKISFGEIVDRPPQLNVLPKKKSLGSTGSESVERKGRDWGSLSASAMLLKGASTTPKIYNAVPAKVKSGERDEGEAAKKRQLDDQRNMAVEAYRKLKLQRESRRVY